MEQLLEKRQATSTTRDRALQRRMLHIARIMSGELTGFGSKVSKVIIDPNGKACTDGKVVYIPQTMTENELHNSIMQEAVLAHEVAGHHRYTDFVAWSERVIQPIKAGDMDPLMHDFTNILEDARINHLLGQDFPGSGRRLDFTHEVFMRNHFAQHSDEMSQKKQAMVAVMCEAIANINHWSDDEKVIAFMDKVRSLLQNAIKQPDTAAVIKQAARLLKMFREHDWDEEDPDPSYTPPEDYQFDEDSGDIVDENCGDEPESESMDDIDKAAQGQREQGRDPEKVSKNRFNDREDPKDLKEQQGNTNTDPDQDWNPDEEVPTDGDEAGDMEGEDSGLGTDGDEDGEDQPGGDCDDCEDGDGDGDGDGEDGDGDGDGDGDSDGDGNEGDSCGAGSDSEEIELHDDDGEFDENEGDRPDSQNNRKGAGWNDGYDDDNDFEDAWSDLISAAEESKDWMNKEAIDEEDDYHADRDAAIDSVRTERMTIDGHTLEVVAGASDMFHHDDFYDSMDDCTGDYDATKEACAAGISDLVMEIKRQLKGRNSRNERGVRRGKVDNSKLHKGLTDGKIFKRKVIPKKVDAAAIILIDASGSMGGGGIGSRARCASEAATVFAEVMESVGVNYEVVDFNTSGGTTLRIRKAMDATLGNTEKAVISQPYSGSCNSDGFAVQWCIDRLDDRKEKAKLLFVISDGQPSGPCNGMGAGPHLKAVTGGCPGTIGLVGIGIAGMDCSPFYPIAVTVSDTTTLADRMLPVLRDMLRKVVQR